MPLHKTKEILKQAIEVKQGMAKISINMKEGVIRKNETPDIIVGIDLGTTNSLVAVIEDGLPRTIRSSTGSNALVPSIIHLATSGHVIVGNEAKAKLVEQPERTIYSVKRLMGKSYADLSENAHALGYKIIDEDTEALVKVQVDEKFYSPIELSALILEELKQIAEQSMGRPVSRAVITVPAYFNDSQRQATRDAGRLAGLDVLRIINEPTAASLAYDFGTARKSSERIAVYDLGGGTFDISILEIDNGVFEVLATHGDTYLGGDDFDKAILDHWCLIHQIEKSVLISDKSFSQSIRLAAEQAKIHLTTEENFVTSLDGRSFSLDRKTFNTLIQPLVERTLDSCRQCVSDSGIDRDQIDHIVMVGGSTRIPLVKDTVSQFFGKEVNDSINPDEVVARGAAIQADILAGNRKDMLLLDITPLSLGIETIGGLMDTIIPRNSKVPAQAGRQYTTSVDGQKNLKIAVFQGERDLVQDNRKLGEFILSDIPPMSAGIPKIDIQFVIDADGVLKVKAKEMRSQRETEVQIKSQYGISEAEMAEMLKDSIVHASTDMATRVLIEAKTEANNIVLHSEKFLSQNRGLLSSDQVETLNTHIDELKSAVTSDDKDLIQLKMETLNIFSAPLAELALDHNISSALKGKDI